MSKKIKVIIDGQPRTKPATSIGLFRGKVRTWNKSTALKETMQWQIMSSLTDEQREMLAVDSNTEIRVKIRYYMTIPSSASLKEKNLMRWGILPHVSKPDCDNACKLSMDTGNGVLWPDDRQLTNVALSKRYSDNPKTEYLIEVRCPMKLSNEARQVLEIYSPAEVSALIDDVWQLFGMYDTAMEIEAIEDPAVLQEKCRLTACVLSRIARNHAKKLSIIAKKFPDLDIQMHRETASGDNVL